MTSEDYSPWATLPANDDQRSRCKCDNAINFALRYAVCATMSRAENITLALERWERQSATSFGSMRDVGSCGTMDGCPLAREVWLWINRFKGIGARPA